MTYSKRFSSKFYARLLKPAGSNPVRDRASSFEIIFELLDQKEDKNFLIVETGCMRRDHGNLAFGDDGASTYIFDDFINFYDGEVHSVDICEDNVNYANELTSDKTTVHCQDSVDFLWNLPKKQIDFLYLDSFDIIKEDPHPSQLHHVKEMCAAIDKLGKGSIVCIDDHNAFFTNDGKIAKGTYVKDFMDDIGMKPIHEGYQIVWVI
tara:strand:+ start:4578 stop:5198 length:621 start_codon:yes stop_codon:yes gene_type:complete